LALTKNKYIIAVGRFVPEKGFHNLIEAYKLANINNYKLVLVGDADHETEYSRKLKQTANKNDVILTGFIKGESLNEIFSHAALFVMPSFHEGLPIALLEALSYDIDVLVSDIPANKEIGLNEDCYFNPSDKSGLSTKLHLKTQNTKKIFCTQAADQLLNKYDWDNIARSTLHVYKGVL
jgi:glycosyltransferase involved in cell wall biosynthesis